MADPIEVAFTVSEEDLVEQTVHLTERSPAVQFRRQVRRGVSLGLISVLVLLGGVVLVESGQGWLFGTAGAIAAAYLLFADLIATAWTRRYARALLRDGSGRNAAGPRRVFLEGNSIRVETPTSVSTIRIEGPVRVEERGGFAYLELGAGEAMFVPLRPAERGDPRAFVDAVRARAAAGSAAGNGRVPGAGRPPDRG